MFFRVKQGMHVQDGKSYKAGDLVEHDQDLSLTFREKFQKVDQEAVANEVAARLGAERPAKSAGSAPGVPAGTNAAVVQDEDEDAPGAGDAGKVEATKPKGKDVSEDFPQAVDEDYKVFKSRGSYYVYDTDDLSKPLNTEGVDKAGVDNVIKTALKA